MKFIIGAYASAPSNIKCSLDQETLFYEKLIDKNHHIGGLEIPFFGNDINVFGTDLILRFIKKNWLNVLTCIPASFFSVQKDPEFGLASKNESSRMEAIKTHKKANKKLHYISDKLGYNPFYSIHIASAPSTPVKGVKSSYIQFYRSLEEICSWQWLGSRIKVEHCDHSITSGFKKGFLSLDNEIKAIQKLNKSFNVGISLNWARSAIEGRGQNKVLEHIEIAKHNKLLHGFIFSGTSLRDKLYGSWNDNHMPFSKIFNVQYYEENSLLNYDNVKSTLQALSDTNLKYLGIKLLSLPLENLDITKRVGINNDALYILYKICNEINWKGDEKMIS